MVVCICWSTNSNIKTTNLCTTAYNFKCYLYVIQSTKTVKNIESYKRSCYRYHREQTDVSVFLFQRLNASIHFLHTQHSWVFKSYISILQISTQWCEVKVILPDEWNITRQLSKIRLRWLKCHSLLKHSGLNSTSKVNGQKI